MAKKTKTPEAMKRIPGTPFFMDERAADMAVEFFDRYLVHVKGDLAGKPFTLEPWQEAITRDLFGRKDEHGLRQYSMMYGEIPRKNGKSTWAAGLALCALFTDNEPGAEIYSAAADTTQASIVFGDAKTMVENNSKLMRVCRVYRVSIEIQRTNSIYRVISSDAFTKHGYNPYWVIFDELHAQPNRDLWDVLQTGMGARAQPMTIAITTAGSDPNSICGEQHDYAVKVRDGIVEDPTLLPVIFAADREDDWTLEETWKKANPNYGVSLKPAFMRKQVRKAKEQPSFINTFKRLYLNIWTETSESWIDIQEWDACGGISIPHNLMGKDAWGGLDLSTNVDTASFQLIIPDGDLIHVLTQIFIPADNVLRRERRDRGAPYLTWADQGYLTKTPGNVIDYDFIEQAVVKAAGIFTLKEVAFDRWNSNHIVQNLISKGIDMVPFGQGYASMSAPTKEFEKLIMAKKIVHGKHPVLRWMLSNTAVDTDPAGNLKPTKKRSTGRIDGIVATIMALGRHIVRPVEQKKKSVYGNRGVATVG